MSALALRRRWAQLEPGQDAITIRVLASYTIDPLVPYLGVRAHDAGLDAKAVVGPLNQIVQQCIDPRSEVARSQPDVLVVAPRFEELGEGSLLEFADAAMAATSRWGAYLLFVLPSLPEGAGLGVGDHGAAGGRIWTAVAAREAVRRRLAGLPNVGLADAEAAVRAVGARRAYHPTLFALAKIPYTEEVFAELGGQLAAVLGTRFGPVVEAIVLDADSLLGVDGADVLGSVLPGVRRAGVRVAVRGSGDLAEVWPRIAAGLGESWRDCLDDWVVDDRALDVQLSDIAEQLGIELTGLALVVAGPRNAEPRVVELGDEPVAWPSELAASGIFDRAPVNLPGAESEVVSASRPEAAMSLEDYVAGLDVQVDFRVGDRDAVPRLAESLIRTKDFTLGTVQSEHVLAERAAIGDIEIHLGRVRDRLGDYGEAVTIALSHRDDLCVVSAFTVSCPVLGKGVEEAALGRILDSARDRGCRTVVFERSDTGRNGLMTDFLDELPEDLFGLAVQLAPGSVAPQ
ncbi:hypothetical protein OG762_49080 (plasmid) [Streptomyces sp. NBC_01136]|uniref:hypothetical protein n=1 Tax=unclassified Streptomyces TaxID=2593676 RepID=UPI002F90E8EF|nr:hypothetical protein OG762_49080 [Streptomyces sp. NBC_01136]